MRHKNSILLAILIIFHTVGIVGLQTNSREYFLSLSPINLLLSIACLLLSFSRFHSKLLLDVILVGVIGFGVEWIGIHTGYLFGNYTYGESLGWKVFNIPLVIALNWTMLSFTSIACVIHLKVSIGFKALLSALLMTGLDVLIEPVAVTSDYWSWENGVIPVFNYICWFLVAYPIHLYLLKRNSVEQNRVSVGLFCILIVFFGILNLSQR